MLLLLLHSRPEGRSGQALLRDLADDFNAQDPRKLYRLARQRDLDVTQAMAFKALKADRLQADLIDFHETAHGALEDVEKQPATEFRVLQDNADRFQHNKDLTNRRIKAVEDAGAFRAPTNAARSFNPQYGDAQRLAAVDSMTVRSTEGRETLLKLALPAPHNSGNAAARLTRRGRAAAVRQLDDFLGPRRPEAIRAADLLEHT